MLTLIWLCITYAYLTYCRNSGRGGGESYGALASPLLESDRESCV